MFWRGTTPWGGFAGLVSGTLAGLVLYGLELAGTIVYGAPMAGNFWWARVICVGVTVTVSLLTSRSRMPDEELRGLVWGLMEKREDVEPPWYKRPVVLAVAVLAIAVALNIIFF
jgi:SSS family solute:Na+ symporter